MTFTTVVQEHDNRATAGVAADLSYQDAVLPMALTIQENLQFEVVDFYEPGFLLQYSDTEPRSEREEFETAALLFEKGIITRNQALIRLGEAPLEGLEGQQYFDE